MSDELVPIDPKFLPPDTQELMTDLDYIRKNQIDLIEKAVQGVEGILDVAGQSQHPRAYEVLANMLKTASELNDALASTAMKKHEAKKVVPEETTGVTNNLNFYGTTTEFLDMVDKLRGDAEDDIT